MPAGWTKDAQVAAGNEDSSSLNTIKLAASPAPKLFVQPVHPLFSRKACVPSDCLPAAKGRRLQGLGSQSRIGPLRVTQDEQDQPDAVVAELQRWDASAEQGGLSRGLNPFFWNLPYNPFGRKAENKASSGGSTPAPNSSSGQSTTPAPATAAPEPSSSSSGSTEPHAEVSTPITGESGSGTPSLKDSIGGGGWTTWKEEEEGWWGGEDRNLQACLTTVAQPAAYDILWNIDGGVAKKATMPKQGAPFILLDNLDTLAPVGYWPL